MKLAQLALGASFLAGMMTAPAMAASYTTTGDVTIFNSNGTNTFLDPSADLGTVLTGNAGAPGGNVELNDGSAGANLAAPANTLTATLDSGRQVTFSSLTAADWFTPDPANGGTTFAQKWFNDMMVVYGAQVRQRAAFFFGGPKSDTFIFNAFNVAGGFARLSDPNIAYINESSAGVTFGLAAHSDAGNVNELLTGFYASEVVKVSLNGVSNYYYSFAQPTASGQTSLDGTKSHEGNYEFFIEDPMTEDVPEPASVLGLVALGGLAIAAKRKAIA